MNALEEQALAEGLRRRGDRRVTAEGLSCTVDQYRAEARKVGRDPGWRIRTYVLTDETGADAAVMVIWADRGHTDMELRAAVTVINSVVTGDKRNYDEVLEDLRRRNLRPVQGT